MVFNICDYCSEQIGSNKIIYKGYDQSFCSISCRTKIIDNPNILFPAPITTHIQRDMCYQQAIIRKTKSHHIISMNDNMDSKRTDAKITEDEIESEETNKDKNVCRLNLSCLYNELLLYICILSIYLYI